MLLVLARCPEFKERLNVEVLENTSAVWKIVSVTAQCLRDEMPGGRISVRCRCPRSMGFRSFATANVTADEVDAVSGC
jgi:hypothetical protein